MFGKEYRLAPVRLTKEQQAMHHKRRSRAHQWKRPTVFLREGDSLPPDVDPDTVRWIPANHPFTAASIEVDEETAKQNIYQKDGVPSRIKAEHEALQTRLEASNDVSVYLYKHNPFDLLKVPIKTYLYTYMFLKYVDRYLMFHRSPPSSNLDLLAKFKT
jgi:hypothetical protein